TQRHALDAKQRALDVRHAKLDRQHAALEARLDRQRDALAAQRSVLTRQRDALQQRRTQAADHTHQAMRKLLDDVLAEGLVTRASRGRKRRHDQAPRAMCRYYLHLAVRSLRRNQLLTAMIVMAIGLGIGASMTM